MFGTTAVATKSLEDYGKLNYGVDYYYEDIDSSRTRINNPTNPNSVPTSVAPQYPDDALADRVGVFLAWEVLVTDRLTVTLHVRYENLNLSGTPEFDTLALATSSALIKIGSRTLACITS